jgi:hypothetical protein
MPRSLIRRVLRHLFLISLASCMLAVFSRGWDEWDERAKPEPDPRPKPQAAPPAAEPARKRGHGRRLATTLSFSILFFAGLALSAGAGNTVRALLEGDGTDATATVGATGPTGLAGAKEAAQAPAAAQAQAAPAAHVLAKPATPTASATAKPAAPRVVVSSSTATARAVQQSPSAAKQTVARANKHATRTHKAPAKKSAPLQPLDAEASLPGATVWIHGPAVDPTPPAARLRIQFARELASYSRQAGVDWALVLAVLRADGHNGRSPATAGQLRSLSLRLARYGGRSNGWAAALAVSSEAQFADRVVALRHYYRAVGMASLVHGLLSQKRDLEDRVLHDQRLTIYSGGRSDIAAHKVDVRVLATMLYLAETFHQVTVSCLISGHRLYARPGVVSAHIYGRAVDIAALGGVSIYGHQQPGGVTEQAVRSLLLLPGGMLPAQVISLLGLGGPSFPLANHYDHIHIGY